MTLSIIKKNKGFVLLFAITLSAAILAIALGIANISLKEVTFGTSAKDANEAFFAADTGAECALYWDKPTNNKFPLAGPATSITCFGINVTPVFAPGVTATYDFTLTDLVSSGRGCVKVNVLKDNTTPPMNTIITSRGYNVGDSACNSSTPSRVERRIRTSYIATPATIPTPSGFLVDNSAGKTLANGLVSYWKLEEASGTRLDVRGINHLTESNTVGQASGKQGSSAQFNIASARYLSHASNTDLQAGNISFTFASWVYLDSKTGAMMPYGKDDGTLGNREYRLRYLNGVDRFDFAVFDAANAQVVTTANSFGSPATGTWYFIVAWHDAAADTLNIQVNNGTVDSVATGGFAPAAGISQFRIGSRQFPGTENYWDGRIDEVGFWKKVLTAQERTDLYNGGVGNTYNP